jgi:hypothetical protein
MYNELAQFFKPESEHPVDRGPSLLASNQDLVMSHAIRMTALVERGTTAFKEERRRGLSVAIEGSASLSDNDFAEA